MVINKRLHQHHVENHCKKTYVTKIKNIEKFFLNEYVICDLLKMFGQITKIKETIKTTRTQLDLIWSCVYGIRVRHKPFFIHPETRIQS